jgi:hypothetical protein
MDRMGHGSVRAAMIYQHSTAQASRLIADSIGGMIQRAQGADDGASPQANGALMARRPGGMITST